MSNEPELQRSKAIIEPDLFRTLFGLSQKQPWLGTKEDEILETLSNCQDGDEYRLVCDLLNRFVYISRQAFDDNIDLIAQHISKVWKCKPDNTLIVGIKKSAYSDSSTMVTYELKSALAKTADWTVTNFLAKYSECAEKIPNDGYIILADEFIGSGETADKAAKWITKDLNTRGKKATVYVATVAAMRASEARVLTSCSDMYATVWMQKAISDHYVGEELTNAIVRMQRLECELSETDGQRKLKDYKFGYRRSESIYYRERGNLPNNVFPLFWWQRSKNNNPRNALFRRAQ